MAFLNQEDFAACLNVRPHLQLVLRALFDQEYQSQYHLKSDRIWFPFSHQMVGVDLIYRLSARYALCSQGFVLLVYNRCHQSQPEIVNVSSPMHALLAYPANQPASDCTEAHSQPRQGHWIVEAVIRHEMFVDQYEAGGDDHPGN